MGNGPKRIENAFRKSNKSGRIAMAPFITAGYPSPESTVPLIKTLTNAGADLIELGVPFSDPLAEGSTIQKSSHKALLQNINPAKCIEMVASARADGILTPIVLMGYYNQIIAMGHKNYCALASEAGVDGLIVADLPASEANELIEVCKSKKLAFVPLLALTSTEESISEACKLGTGFIYCISVLGVTGVREQMNQRVEQLVGKVRQYTDLPIAVGFGVSKPNHIQELRRYADGAIIGSALINAIGTGSNTEVTNRAHNFIRSLDSNITD